MHCAQANPKRERAIMLLLLMYTRSAPSDVALIRPCGGQASQTPCGGQASQTHRRCLLAGAVHCPSPRPPGRRGGGGRPVPVRPHHERGAWGSDPSEKADQVPLELPCDTRRAEPSLSGSSCTLTASRRPSVGRSSVPAWPLPGDPSWSRAPATERGHQHTSRSPCCP